MTSRLKLAATDHKDLTVLSSLLQDATVLVGDMAYDADVKQFLMVAARFLIDDDGSKKRRLMGINIDHVETVRKKGIVLGNRDQVLNLLGMTLAGKSIDLIFSGQSMLKLETTAIKVYAADLDEGWTTAFQPSHDDDLT